MHKRLYSCATKQSRPVLLAATHKLAMDFCILHCQHKSCSPHVSSLDQQIRVSHACTIMATGQMRKALKNLLQKHTAGCIYPGVIWLR